jgi:hypothetical protein
MVTAHSLATRSILKILLAFSLCPGSALAQESVLSYVSPRIVPGWLTRGMRDAGFAEASAGNAPSNDRRASNQPHRRTLAMEHRRIP